MENQEVVERESWQSPAKIVEQGTEAAKILSRILASQKNPVIINGKRYNDFAAWQTIARFHNVTVGTEWTKPITDVDGVVVGYEAKATAVDKNGAILSSAESACMRDEPKWNDPAQKPLFMLRSMAQTRAAVKTLKNLYSWVMVLAGFDPNLNQEDIAGNGVRVQAQQQTKK